MSVWYYSDYERNRLGPVAARDLAELHEAGQLLPETLVWREGMPRWRAWREVMSQALNEAAGRSSPAAEAVPLSAGVNPYAMAEPLTASSSTGASAAAAPLSAGVNPYSIAEPRPATTYERAEPHSPYAPPRAAVYGRSDHVVGGEIVYAGFWKRVAAYIIDSFVLGIAGAIIGAVIGGVMGAGGVGMGAIQAITQILSLLLGATYFGLMHASGTQASLGKMAIGIKVVDEQGDTISFWRGFGRYFGLLLSSLTLCIGFAMAGFTDRKRALHDMICSTLVVDKWAYTNHPERQSSELGTLTIVILVIGGVLMLAMVVLLIAAFGVLFAAAGGR